MDFSLCEAVPGAGVSEAPHAHVACSVDPKGVRFGVSVPRWVAAATALRRRRQIVKALYYQETPRIAHVDDFSRHLQLERCTLHGWSAGAARYIGFLRGKGDVSEYLREFLGCDAIMPERQDTIRLVEALSNDATQSDMGPGTHRELLSKAKTICDRAINQGKELDFKALANELQPADPQPLVETLSDPDLALIDGFVLDRGAR